MKAAIRVLAVLAAGASLVGAQQRDTARQKDVIRPGPKRPDAVLAPNRTTQMPIANQVPRASTRKYADSMRTRRSADSPSALDLLRQPPARVPVPDAVLIQRFPSTVDPNARIAVPLAIADAIRDSVGRAGALWFTFDSTMVTPDSVARDSAYLTVPSDLEGGKSYAVSAVWEGVRSPATVVAVERSAGQWVRFVLVDNRATALVFLVAGLGIVLATVRTRQRSAARREELERAAAAQRRAAEYAERQQHEAQDEIGRLRYEAELGTSSAGNRPDLANAAPSEWFPPVPDVPGELVEACASGTCVFFAGSGLGAQAGLPTTRMLLSRLLVNATASDGEQRRREFVQALNHGKYAVIGDLIGTRLPRQEILEAARGMYVRDVKNLPEIHTRLRNIPFASAVSYGWDDLLERTFKHRDPVVVFPTREARVERLTSDAFRILKPWGSVSEADTFLFTTAESQRAARSNRSFNRVLGSLALSNSWFFVGASVQTVDEFLSNLPERLDRTRRHFALVPREEDWTIQEELFREKYGVQLLGFAPSQGWPEVLTFVRTLEEQVQLVLPHVPSSDLTADTLGRVVLHNIGAFEDLELAFNPRWNVLLGNNGSGKSTILRAIALGICGQDEDAASAARSLLRAGATAGSIQLTVGSARYQTNIRRDGTKVRVESITATALEKGKWVVLGFPPLRGVSTKNSSGPGGDAGAPVPVVEDLLPLIRGSFDSRMDNLKQWIVNVHARSTSRDPSEAARFLALRKSFFRVLKTLTPGAFIDFDTVYSDTWEVRVATADGSIPIDQVSQGMSSILGWVGTMLQRMYEIHRNAEHPELEPALVLVDELEAHLHPEWQQRVVGLIRECFPKLQIIATSHSPLVVAGMKASEIIIARRSPDDPTKVLVEPAPLEFEGMRADQVLTSPAFGLASTRGEQVAVDIKRYNELRQRTAERGAEVEGELAMLRARIEKVFEPAENDARKRVVEAVSATLRQMADPVRSVVEAGTDTLTPEIRYELMKRLDEIMPSEAKRGTPS